MASKLSTGGQPIPQSPYGLPFWAAAVNLAVTPDAHVFSIKQLTAHLPHHSY